MPPLTLLDTNTFTGVLTLLTGANITALFPMALGSTAGRTQVNAGTLIIATAVAESATVAGGINVPYNGTIVLTGGFLNVANALTGSVAVSGGTLSLNRAGAAPVVTTGGLLVLGNTDANFTGAISVINGSVVLNRGIISADVNVTALANGTAFLVPMDPDGA
jgi:hypothetical protein